MDWLLAALLPLSLAANPLEPIRTDSWVYDAFDCLKTSGFVRSVPSTSRPWTRQYARGLLEEAIQASQQREPAGLAGWHLTRLIGELKPELLDNAAHRYRKPRPLLNAGIDSANALGFDFFSRVLGDTSNQKGSLGLLLTTRSSRSFAAHARMELSVARETLECITDSAWIRHIPGTRNYYKNKRAMFDMAEAGMRFRIPWFELDLGRGFLYWGPGYTGSVMLSNTAPSMDRVQLTGTYRRFKITWFTAMLSPWRNYHRFLSGQRLEVNFLDRVVAGMGVLAAWSDSAQTKSAGGYLNPFIPIFPEIANAGHDDNLLLGIDIAAWLPRTKLYGQFLIDNVELTRRSSHFRPPDAVAFQAGALAAAAPNLNLSYEYTKITNFSYYHRIYHVAYTTFDVPLGHELGPDADQHFAGASLLLFPGNRRPAPGPGLRTLLRRVGNAFRNSDMDLLSATIMSAAHGLVVNVGNAFRNSDLSLNGAVTRRGDRNRGDWTGKFWKGDSLVFDFPTGKVEQRFSLGPQLSLTPAYQLRLTAGAGWYHSRWYEHGVTVAPPEQQLPVPKQGPTFNFKLEYRYN